MAGWTDSVTLKCRSDAAARRLTGAPYPTRARQNWRGDGGGADETATRKTARLAVGFGEQGLADEQSNGLCVGTVALLVTKKLLLT